MVGFGFDEVHQKAMPLKDRAQAVSGAQEYQPEINGPLASTSVSLLNFIEQFNRGLKNRSDAINTNAARYGEWVDSYARRLDASSRDLGAFESDLAQATNERNAQLEADTSPTTCPPAGGGSAAAGGDAGRISGDDWQGTAI
jgi:hypothetical protein